MATVRYFAPARPPPAPPPAPAPAPPAGARPAAGGRRHAALADVLPRCSLLVGGVRAASDDTPVAADETVDVLPPFAGG